MKTLRPGMRKTPSAKPLQDSVVNDSIMGRPSTRRVSFSRVISVWGVEREASQFPLSSVSDDMIEVCKPPDLVENLHLSATAEVSDMSGLLDEEDARPGTESVSSTAPPDMELTLSELNQSLDMSVCTGDGVSTQQAPVESDSPMELSSPANGSVQIESHSVEPKTPPGNSPAVELDQFPLLVPSTGPTSEHESSEDDTHTPVPSLTSSVTPETNQAPLSNRPLTCNLPPLRRNPDMSVVDENRPPVSENPHIKTGYRILGTRNTPFTKTQGKLGDTLMSHSLAVTPLRQVNDRIPSDSSRFDPERFIPAAARLHSHLMDQSSYPVCEDPSREVLSAALASNRFPMDTENRTGPVFPDNLDKLKHFMPELYEEFMHARRAVEAQCMQRLSEAVQMCESRHCTVVNENWTSKPVSAQLGEMDRIQLCKFFAEAYERVFQLESVVKQEYLDRIQEDELDYNNEQKWEMERLAKRQQELDQERQRLERQSKELDDEIKSWLSVRDQWNKTSKDLEAADVELRNLMIQMEKLTEELSHIDKSLSKKLSTPPTPGRHPCGPATFAVGAMQLFSPIENECVPAPGNNSEEAIDELAKLYLPCSIECASFKDHVYSVRSLFGLISFTFVCTTVQSTATSAKSETVPVVPPNNLTVLTVKCCAPPRDCTPVDCEAVEAFAEYTIQFFNSWDGQQQLKSRFVGLSFDRAIKQLEFILTPYLLFAMDLRACYLSAASVQFEATPPVELTSSVVSTQKSFFRSTPGRSLISTELNQSSRPACSDSVRLDRILPAGPVTVVVTIFNQESRTVVSLRFTFSSIEVHQTSTPTRSVNVVLGNIDVERIRQLLESAEVKPTCMHRVVTAVQKLIVST